jgi:3-deoxy-D-manno-octulosonic acid kinase
MQEQYSSVVDPRALRLQHAYLLYDAATVADPRTLSFSPRELAQRGALVGETNGRGRTYFIRINSSDWVLRHYHRGGMFAGVLRDNYLWTGMERTRAWKEWRMLHKLFEWGLPVPRPIAAQVVRSALTYKADLITERLQGTRSLTQVLSQQTLDDDGWKAIGSCIRRFHDSGVYHADLNAHNILLTEAKDVYLIDFDKSTLGAAAHVWRARNLARLQRSLTKLESLLDGFHYSEAAWQLLCAGYDGATGKGASGH